MQMAIERDQAALSGDIDNPQVHYVDNGGEMPVETEPQDFQEADVVDEQTGEVQQKDANGQATMFDK